MTTPASLIQLLLSLLSDPQTAAEFQSNPTGFLASCGITDVTAEQVHDALVLVDDHPKPHGGGEHHHTPPPPHPEPGHTHHETAVKYLQTIVTNNWIDDRDTTVDSSVNQVIHAGGDVHQVIDNDQVIASGDGAVAAGGDIEDSQIVTGDDNVIGNQNVTGDANTTAFGNGAATSAEIQDVTVSDGGALSVTGPAAGTSTTAGSFNDTTTTTSFDDSFNDSFTSTTDVDVDDHSATTTGSNNHVDDGSHNTFETTIG